MPHRFPQILVAWFAASCPLAAHTVPTLTVEAEFSSAREVTLRVNLDPRLFLSAQPATLPPVPASWWLEQDEAARLKTSSDAVAYLKNNLRFQVGGVALDAAWRVIAIDSASAFPLGANSSETHLLAEHRGSLPGVMGDFKVELADGCAVGLILLNSLEGKAERHPQALFPGESSRGFKLPERPSQPPAPAGIENWPPSLAGCCDALARCWRPGSRHFAGDHLLVAVLLAATLGGKWLRAAGMILAFQAAHVAAAFAVLSGWLPDAPMWMQSAGWAALAAGLFAAHQNRLAPATMCLATAGLAHGLNLPHLHLAAPGGIELLRDTGLVLAVQAVTLAAGCFIVLRCGQDRREDCQSC